MIMGNLNLEDGLPNFGSILASENALIETFPIDQLASRQVNVLNCVGIFQ
jgi:hypothetical protein